MWTAPVREAIKRAEGSVQAVAGLPEDLKLRYRTAWELPQRALIDMAAARAPYIDQSQSLNLFMSAPNIGKLSSMYLHAWKSGLKTTYYLRSRPATRIQQATVAVAASSPPALTNLIPLPLDTAAAEALACSLENPESCEACQ
jgi:ribonucleoside-diphosphate reductase alpha chain